MALQGNLKDFSITEIIQLIGQQLKTGVLKIQRGKDIVEISFVDGMIVHIYSNFRGKKDLIGEILVKAELITEEQLDRVLKIQKESFRYLGEILVELQLLAKEDVLKVISTQIYETIYDLFWWEDGSFNFDLKLVESYQKIPFALSTEQVLLSILRMVDEWSEIEKKIFSVNLVFRKTTRLEGKLAQELSPEIKERLTSEQELIYNLTDGTRTVQEIIDRSLLGKFNTCEILANLMELGLIEVIGVQTPSLMRKVKAVDFRRVFTYGLYGASLVLIFVIIVYLKPNFLKHVWDSKVVRADIELPSIYIHQSQMDRIKNALEIYCLEKGKYPDQLEELVPARLLRRSDLYYQKGISFQYELKDGKYLLKH
jgi:hypothetical protein